MRDAIAANGQQADVEFSGAGDTMPQFVHRRLKDGDLYFVSNRSNKPVKLAALTAKGPVVMDTLIQAFTPT